MTLLNIEVYSDLICPWCYIGRRRLEAGINIGKNEVLAKVAADAGLSEEDARRFLESGQGRHEVLEEEREGLRRGLNGVPFFVINGIPAFSGAQGPDTFVETFRQVLGAEPPKCGSESCSV